MLSSFVVSWQRLNKTIFSNLLGKIPLCFHNAPITPFKIILWGKAFFFVHHPRIISRCLSSSVLLWNKQSVAPGNIGSKLGQVPNSIVTINHSLTHFNDIHGFLREVTATKMEKLPSFIYTPTSNPVNEYKHFLLYNFPVFHFQGF